MTLRDKLAAVKRYAVRINSDREVNLTTGIVGISWVNDKDYDALLRALDVAIRQRDGYRRNYHDVCRLAADERTAIEEDNDAEILAAYEGKERP